MIIKMPDGLVLAHGRNIATDWRARCGRRARIGHGTVTHAAIAK